MYIQDKRQRRHCYDNPRVWHFNFPKNGKGVFEVFRLDDIGVSIRKDGREITNMHFHNFYHSYIYKRNQMNWVVLRLWPSKNDRDYSMFRCYKWNRRCQNIISARDMHLPLKAESRNASRSSIKAPPRSACRRLLKPSFHECWSKF